MLGSCRTLRKSAMLPPTRPGLPSARYARASDSVMRIRTQSRFAACPVMYVGFVDLRRGAQLINSEDGSHLLHGLEFFLCPETNRGTEKAFQFLLKRSKIPSHLIPLPSHLGLKHVQKHTHVKITKHEAPHRADALCSSRVHASEAGAEESDEADGVKGEGETANANDNDNDEDDDDEDVGDGTRVLHEGWLQKRGPVKLQRVGGRETGRKGLNAGIEQGLGCWDRGRAWLLGVFLVSCHPIPLPPSTPPPEAPWVHALALPSVLVRDPTHGSRRAWFKFVLDANVCLYETARAPSRVRVTKILGDAHTHALASQGKSKGVSRSGTLFSRQAAC
jgi:hypothetical protein